MVGIARLDQQGTVDLGGRRLGVRVDDVSPRGDEAVGEAVEDQRYVAAAVAVADSVHLLTAVRRPAAGPG